MSIVESLKRLFDPATHRYEKGEREAEEEEPVRDADGDPPTFQLPPRPDGPQEDRHFRCRLCGWVDHTGAYCRHCLSETMSPHGRDGDAD